jgi:N-acetylneuraminic acid mutarotase
MLARNLLRRVRTTVLVGVLAALGVVSAASAQGTWTALAPVPAPTEGMQVGQIGNDIIAAYGFSGVDTNLTRIYDIDSDSWSIGSAAPLPNRSEGAAATHAGNLYALGGRSATVLADNDRYTPATDTWVSLASMPTPRAGLGAAVVGNSIYAIGGRTGTTPCSGTPLATVERYDIASNTWTAVAPLPTARSDLAAIDHGGKIYAFGGCMGSFAATNLVDVYNPTTNTWSTAPADMPTPRSSFYGVGKKGNEIYAIGGQDNFVQLAVNEVYNVAKNTWSTDTPMPSPRAEMGVVSHGGRIYTVGGGFFGSSSNLNLVFKP